METRRVGSLEVSVAGLGCNQIGLRLDAEESDRLVAAALGAGVRFFDTSDEYGHGRSEELLGAALGANRADVVLATKFGVLPPPDGVPPGSAQWVGQACEDSLRRLGTDWIDLYIHHYPDPGTPVIETLGALEALRAEGKVREIGCSNVTAQQLREAADAATQLGVPGFVNVQCGYSVLDRTPEPELIPSCLELGAAVVPYSPLANGMLTGKYRRGEPAAEGSRLSWAGEYFPGLARDECFDIVEGLEAFAAGHGHSLHELALSWLAAQPVVAGVIAGATTADQVRANVAATTAWALSADELAAIDALTSTEISYTLHPWSPAYSNGPRATPDRPTS